jgi:uncharacterized protein (DUF433 family)
MTPISVHTEDEEQQLVLPGHPLHGLVWVDPGRMSGTPCFDQTRVPVAHLWDYLVEGPSFDEFMEDFEGVDPEKARAVLRHALKLLLDTLPKP